MPIDVQSAAETRRLSEDGFKEIAYAVTGAVFDVHNRYGQFFCERTYKYELATECRKRGLREVETEVPIRVSFHDFEKCYFMDLLIDGGAVFELKVASALNDEHVNQTLNYLYLTELNRAKVFNFGSDRVEGRFVSTQLTLSKRRQYALNVTRWRTFCSEDHKLHDLMIALLDDWGGFLSIPLYQDAITHFFGGEDAVIQPISVVRDGKEVTTQLVHLHGPGIAFKLTALSEGLDVVEDHMRRFLHSLKLRGIQWINLYHHDIQFISLIDE